MGCLYSFPSLVELCAYQTDGNLSFETGLFQDAKMQGVSVLTVMDQPKQPANLKGELFF